MGLIISGPFSKIAQVRDFVQGKEKPFIEGSRSGYSYFGMVDDTGGGDSVLMLSDAFIPKKSGDEALKIRESFVTELRKAAPMLDIKKG